MGEKNKTPKNTPSLIFSIKSNNQKLESRFRCLYLGAPELFNCYALNALELNVQISIFSVHDFVWVKPRWTKTGGLKIPTFFFKAGKQVDHLPIGFSLSRNAKVVVFGWGNLNRDIDCVPDCFLPYFK